MLPVGHIHDGALDVWCANLDAAPTATFELLSPAERLRAARIPSEHRRARWTRSRGLLRALLGAYLDVDPLTLRFVHGPHGKPALAGDSMDDRGLPLSFNLSHSGPLALYAVTSGASVGCDVEVHTERPRDESALAERVFGAAPAARLRALDPAERRLEFLRLWVRHEAALKCLGHGLTTADAPVHADLDSPLWISEFHPAPHATAAVALAGGPRELRLLNLPPGGPPLPPFAALRGQHGAARQGGTLSQRHPAV